MVFHAACLTATVHGENAVAHIHSTKWKRRCQNISEGASTCHVAMVYETLAWYTRLVAYLCEHGSRYGVACIFLCGVELDDRTASKQRVVGRVIFFAIVGMPGMGVVG